MQRVRMLPLAVSVVPLEGKVYDGDVWRARVIFQLEGKGKQ